MGFRIIDDAADVAAHKVENELKNPSSEQASQALRETFLTLSAASPSVQQEFLRDLNSDDPAAMSKIKALVPDLSITGGEGKAIHVKSDNLTTNERAGIWAAAAIVEDGGFGNSNERGFFRSAMLESSPAEVAKSINEGLASIGNTTEKVGLEPAANAGDPSELVLRKAGHKEDAIVVPEIPGSH